MSKNMAEAAMYVVGALAILVAIGWWSYYAAKSNQEKLNGIFGKYGTRERRVWRLFVYAAGSLVSAVIAYGGYRAAVPIAMYVGIYGLLGIAVHRTAYELGKRAGTDPDAHYE